MKHNFSVQVTQNLKDTYSFINYIYSNQTHNHKYTQEFTLTIIQCDLLHVKSNMVSASFLTPLKI